MVASWEKGCHRDCIQGGVGKSADTVAWSQGFLVEAANVSDTSFAQVLLDLVKLVTSLGTGI